MQKTKKLFIIGDSAFAEVAYECFTHNSAYEVIGFAIESQYLKRDSLFGLPILPFEHIEQSFKPGEVEFYAALVYSQLNRLRTRLYESAKRKGYSAASYVSTRAFVWHNVELGEHCFISSQVVISGFCNVGKCSFLGVNATLANNVSLGEDNWIGPGVTILRDTKPNQLFAAEQPPASKVSSKRLFKVGDD